MQCLNPVLLGFGIWLKPMPLCSWLAICVSLLRELKPMVVRCVTSDHLWTKRGSPYQLGYEATDVVHMKLVVVTNLYWLEGCPHSVFDSLNFWCCEPQLSQLVKPAMVPLPPLVLLQWPQSPNLLGQRLVDHSRSKHLLPFKNTIWARGQETPFLTPYQYMAALLWSIN